MQRKFAVILPFFGTLPGYFDLALKTYEANSDFDWLIFTDDRRPRQLPPNVIVTHTTLDQLRRDFQRHFDFPIALGRPYKLCDYKPLYGHLFADRLQGYDFWGHFDPDVVFGRLRRFITDEVCQRYDKLGVKGHFSLYRNTPAVNLLYQQKTAHCLYYRDVLSSERNWAFDERDVGVNAFFAARGRGIYTGFPVADVYFMDYAMRLLADTAADRAKARKSCFAYDQGDLYRYYWMDGGVHREEFTYIHLMRRPMDVFCRSRSAFLIYQNAFREMEPVTRRLLESANRNRFFYHLRAKLRVAVYLRCIKPALRVLFVERNPGKLVTRLLERSRLLPGDRRRPT